MNVELVAQMFKNYQSNVLFHLEGRMHSDHAGGLTWLTRSSDGKSKRSTLTAETIRLHSRKYRARHTMLNWLNRAPTSCGTFSEAHGRTSRNNCRALCQDANPWDSDTVSKSGCLRSRWILGVLGRLCSHLECAINRHNYSSNDNDHAFDDNEPFEAINRCPKAHSCVRSRKRGWWNFSAFQTGSPT